MEAAEAREVVEAPKSGMGGNGGRVGARWRRLSFGFRLTLVGGLVSSLLVVTISIAGMIIYRADKMPYLYEMQLKKVRILEARMRLHLRSRAGARVVSLQEFPYRPENVFLPRLPLGEEVFVAKIKENMLVVGREGADRLWVRPLGSLKEFWEAGDDIAYAITTGAIPLGSNRAGVLDASEGLKRQGIDDFFRSGMTTGTRLIKGSGSERIVSHREVNGTNVVVFSEMDVSAMLRPMNRFFVLVAYAVLVTAWLVFMVAGYYFHSLIRPIRLLMGDMASVLTGGRRPSWDHEFDDEFSRLHNGMDLIAVDIHARARMLDAEEESRHACNALVLRLASASDQHEALHAVAVALVSGLRWDGVPSVTLFLFPEVSGEADAPGRLWKLPLAHDGVAPAHLHGAWDDGWDLGALSRFVAQGRPVIENEAEARVPLLLGKIPLGFLVITGVRTKALDKARGEWLVIFSRIAGQALWFLNPPQEDGSQV